MTDEEQEELIVWVVSYNWLIVKMGITNHK